MTGYINFALQQIRVWAERFATHICVVAHPRKMPTDGKPRPPCRLRHLRQCRLRQQAALGFTVHQDEDDEGRSFVRVLTWKVRDSQLYGFEKGQVRLAFERDRMRYGASSV